ncbi:MAG: SPOR domain-containing protein [Alphaproteobacteria bacterium]
MNTDFEQNLSHQVVEKVSGNNGAAGSKWLPYVIAVIGILGVVAIVGFIYGKAQNPTEDDSTGEIPLITASKDDIKVRPDIPGGLNIPHQNRLVFDSLLGEDGTSTEGDLSEIEAQLAPAPETPIQTPDVTALLTEQNTATEPVTILMAESSNNKKEKEAARKSLLEELGLNEDPIPAPATPTTGSAYPMPSLPSLSGNIPAATPIVTPAPQKIVAAKPIVKPKPKPVVKAKVKPKPKPVVKAKPKPKPAPKKVVKKTAPAIKATSGGKYRVQLGAFSKESSATSEAARLKASMTPLKGLQTFVVPKTSSTGTVYKVQAGNLGSHAAATEVCTLLKAKGQGCFVALQK